jgi:parallel beta-helix repeat protein
MIGSQAVGVRGFRRVWLGLLGLVMVGVAWGQPPVAPERPSADDAVPLTSGIQVLNNVPIEVGPHTYKARLQYIPLPSSNQVVLFPVWVVSEVQVEDNGTWRPLTLQDKLPVGVKDKLPRLRVTVKNLLAEEEARDKIVQRVRQEVERKNNLRNPGVVDPKLDEGSLRLRLFVYWEEAGKDWVISQEGRLSKTALSDDRGSRVVVVLDGEQLGVLGEAQLGWGDVQAEVVGLVQARLEKQLLQAQLGLVQQQWVQLRNRLRPQGESLGEPQVLVAVPLREGQSQESLLQGWLWQQWSVELKVRAGVEAEHVRYVLEQLVGLVREEVKLGSMGEQQVVSVLLGQQVGLTGTVGEIRKLARTRGQEREAQVEALVKQYRDYQQGNKQAVGGGVRILRFSSGGYVSEESNRREVQSDEQLGKDLQRGLDYLQEHFEGRVPVVMGIRLDQESVGQRVKQLQGQVNVSQFITAWITHTWPALRLPLSAVKVESKGLAGMIQAAAEGEEVKLPAGRYVLDKGIVVDKSLVIRGAGAEQTILILRGGEFGLRFTGPCKWELHGVTVEYVGNGWANLVEADGGSISISECRFLRAKRDEQAKRGGVGLWLKGTVRAELSQCVCKGNDLQGIQVSEQANADLLENTCEENIDTGIAYLGKARGVVRKNVCRGNEKNGIYVGDAAQPTLENNTCEGNKGGIGYVEKAGGVAKNNVCRGNETHGIYVGGQGQPTLENNTCEGNKESGIAYFHMAGGVAKNNVCRGNLLGIGVVGQAQPTLENNTCEGNKESGIAYGEKAGGVAENNVCRGNLLGIGVVGQAQPTLENNTCEGNKESGIAYVDKAGGVAKNNVCRGNEKNGIYVCGQAQPTLENNTCEGNKWSGIAYFDKAGGLAKNNVCRGNETHGIYVGAQAQPTLEENTCEGNKWRGIAYFDKAGGVAKNNVCRGNEKNGIYVGGQAQPTLENNTCEGNKWSGIAYVDKAGGVARKNVCRNNGDDKIYVADTARPKIED